MPVDPNTKKSWVRVLPPLPDPAELLKKRIPVLQSDPYVGSTEVKGLDQLRFHDFLRRKDSVLVMFYDPADPKCVWSKDQFSKAAETKQRDGQAYAAVDCSKEIHLCAKENVELLPFFKLYTMGRAACYVGEYRKFPANAMLKFLDHADLISIPRDPRDDKAKSYVEALWAIVENLPLKRSMSFS